MENFVKLLRSTYDDKEKVEYLVNILNECKNKKCTTTIYDFDFAIAVGKNIIENKMDMDTIIIAILYCLVRCGLYNLEEIQNQEYISKINSLHTMSKLELTNKQDTQVSLNKMFLSMAKDIRVMIIKLCIEVEKLNILDKFTNEGKDTLMKSHRDVYSPIASMLGISRIKDAMEDATFKYFNPKMYKELEETINTYVATGIDKINDAVDRLTPEL